MAEFSITLDTDEFDIMRKRTIERLGANIQSKLTTIAGTLHGIVNEGLSGSDPPVGQYRRHDDGKPNVFTGRVYPGFEVLNGPISGQINVNTGFMKSALTVKSAVRGKATGERRTITAYVGWLGLQPSVNVSAAVAASNWPVRVKPVPTRIQNANIANTDDEAPPGQYIPEMLLGSNRVIGRNVLRLGLRSIKNSKLVENSIKTVIENIISKPESL